MSLYNMLFGMNRMCPILMECLELDPMACGRIRDCYLQRQESGKLEIHLLTRNGGGNRQEHEAITERLRRHPRFMRDYDEPHDTTYATYVFSIPDHIEPQLREVVTSGPPEAQARRDELVPPPFGSRFLAFMDRMKTDPTDPEVERVRETMKPIFDQIAKKL